MTLSILYLNNQACHVNIHIVCVCLFFFFEVQEMEQTLPSTCRVKFEDPHQLHDFQLTVTPDEGYWAGGRFRFHIYVTEDYNMAVSTN
jgi:hypothetical protein